MAQYEVIVARRAEEMLYRHIKFLAKVSPQAAETLYRAFEEVVNKLEENPYLFQVDEDSNLPKGKYHRAIFAKRYKALYCIDNTTVYVDAILDSRQNIIRERYL